MKMQRGLIIFAVLALSEGGSISFIAKVKLITVIGKASLNGYYGAEREALPL